MKYIRGNLCFMWFICILFLVEALWRYNLGKKYTWSWITCKKVEHNQSIYPFVRIRHDFSFNVKYRVQAPNESDLNDTDANPFYIQTTYTADKSLW